MPESLSTTLVRLIVPIIELEVNCTSTIGNILLLEVTKVMFGSGIPVASQSNVTSELSMTETTVPSSRVEFMIVGDSERRET